MFVLEHYLFVFSLLVIAAAMVKHSWPHAVTSWEDIVKFAQLLFGKDVRVENYSSRLPTSSQESFLLFAKGACKAPRPFSAVRRLISRHLGEIENFEEGRGNSAQKLKSQEVGGRKGNQVYYYSSQVTCEPCTCRTFFGADAHQWHIPTSSGCWEAGAEFHQLLDHTLAENFKEFGNTQQLPAWMEKSWQVVFNKNNHNQGHGIDPHTDWYWTYQDGDPITSFSFGRGGILTLESIDRKGGKKILYQEDGDVLIMSGNFQREYLHGVPERSKWNELMQDTSFVAIQEWEQIGMASEVKQHNTCDRNEEHLRFNCTLRWHHSHETGCPMALRGASTPEFSESDVVLGDVAASSTTVQPPPGLPGSGLSSAATGYAGVKRRNVSCEPGVIAAEVTSYVASQL